jgi:hypothetical protein
MEVVDIVDEVRNVLGYVIAKAAIGEREPVEIRGVLAHLDSRMFGKLVERETEGWVRAFLALEAARRLRVYDGVYTIDLIRPGVFMVGAKLRRGGIFSVKIDLGEAEGTRAS